MEVIILAKNKKEPLPFHIAKDRHMIRLKLKEKMDGVSKRYGKIPKRFWSSMIIVVGICIITLIALFTGSRSTDLADPNTDLTNVGFDDLGQIQAQVPATPQFELEMEDLPFELPTNQSQSIEESDEEELTEPTTKMMNTPVEAGNLQVNAEQPSELAIIYPLQRQGPVITDFGWYYHPILEVWRFHRGVDLRCKKGDIVMVASYGKIIQIKETDEEAIMIIVDHGGGWTTTYGQIGDANVRIGDQVAKGQKIGKVGQSSTAIEPHLHFEIRQDGELVNPGEYLF